MQKFKVDEIIEVLLPHPRYSSGTCKRWNGMRGRVLSIEGNSVKFQCLSPYKNSGYQVGDTITLEDSLLKRVGGLSNIKLTEDIKL